MSDNIVDPQRPEHNTMTGLYSVFFMVVPAAKLDNLSLLDGHAVSSDALAFVTHNLRKPGVAATEGFVMP